MTGYNAIRTDAYNSVSTLYKRLLFSLFAGQSSWKFRSTPPSGTTNASWSSSGATIGDKAPPMTSLRHGSITTIPASTCPIHARGDFSPTTFHNSLHWLPVFAQTRASSDPKEASFVRPLNRWQQSFSPTERSRGKLKSSCRYHLLFSLSSHEVSAELRLNCLLHTEYLPAVLMHFESLMWFENCVSEHSFFIKLYIVEYSLIWEKCHKN